MFFAMALPNLEAMLARARDGDRDALSAVFDAHEPGLRRMVELRLDRALRRRLEPADVVQETLLEAARRFDAWRAAPAFPFRVWLRSICASSLVNAQRTHLGAQKRDVARERPVAAERPSVSSANAAELFVASQTSPSQAAMREEAHDALQRALDELDELDREIVVLRSFEELSNEEAAIELGIEPTAASKRFARALARLRPSLRMLERD